MVAYFKQRPETGKNVMTIFYFEGFTSILNFKYTSDYSFLDSDGKNLNAKRVPPHPVEHVLDRLAHAVEVARTRAVRFHLLLRVLGCERFPLPLYVDLVLHEVPHRGWT